MHYQNLIAPLEDGWFAQFITHSGIRMGGENQRETA